MTTFLMERPVSPQQLVSAARELGFTIGPADPAVTVDADSATPRPGATVLLAALEAIIVRWQIDQDLRDPVDQHTKRAITLFAQTAVAADTGDLLTAALRRLQTVAGLLGAPAQDDGPTYPGLAATALLSATTSLLVAWIATYALQQPPEGVMSAHAALSLNEDTVRQLATQAEQHLAAATAAVRAWRGSRNIH